MRFHLSATDVILDATTRSTPPSGLPDEGDGNHEPTTGGSHDSAGPAAIYTDRRDTVGAERDALTVRWNRIANARLAAFILAAVSFGLGIWSGSVLPFVVGAVALAVFIGLAIFHYRLGRRRARAALLHDLNVEGLARLARDWEGLPLRPEAAALRSPTDHPYAGDLDIFGRASLLHLLDTTSTPFGLDRLASWLLDAARPEAARARQAAVAELAPLLPFRQELTVRGRFRTRTWGDPGPFLEWAEGPRWLASRMWLRVAALLWTVAFWGAFAGALAGFWPNRTWVLVLIVNFGFAHLLLGRAHEVVERALSQGRAVQAYADCLEHLASRRFTAPELARLQEDLSVADAPAHARLRRLGRIVSFAIPRDSPLYLPLQAVTGWDIHQLAALERWQAANGSRVRAWLDDLGEAEALAALAGLAFDQPEWVFPDLDPDADRYEATQLGHPMLADGERVVNDVTIGPPRTFLLVTGSNMSGKSTLLRAIGVNAILAGAGGPVCAASLRLPPVRVWTSVRVEDSLARGVSFFMAELLRLKLVVDAADNGDPDAPRLLYLLDEILQGTNTAERQIAARRIIAHLVASGALGAVSTHDLDLAAGPPLAESAHPIHFRERVHDGTLSFDYRARPGLATSTNALKLMELVGLPVEE